AALLGAEAGPRKAARAIAGREIAAVLIDREVADDPQRRESGYGERDIDPEVPGEMASVRRGGDPRRGSRAADRLAGDVGASVEGECPRGAVRADVRRYRAAHGALERLGRRADNALRGGELCLRVAGDGKERARDCARLRCRGRLQPGDCTQGSAAA